MSHRFFWLLFEGGHLPPQPPTSPSQPPLYTHTHTHTHTHTRTVEGGGCNLISHRPAFPGLFADPTPNIDPASAEAMPALVSWRFGLAHLRGLRSPVTETGPSLCGTNWGSSFVAVCLVHAQVAKRRPLATPSRHRHTPSRPAQIIGRRRPVHGADRQGSAGARVSRSGRQTRCRPRR